LSANASCARSTSVCLLRVRSVFVAPTLLCPFGESDLCSLDFPESSHAHSSGRQLQIETFHAKLVVADEALAYVGSANLLSSSEGLCLETGFLVEGAAASDVARLVDAVLRIARKL